jgi:hypothetical protein
MESRLRVSLLLAVIASLVGIWALPATADATVTMADRFASQSFSGNDGEVAFSGPWTELGESNGPDTGPVYVWANPHCAGGSGLCLKIGGDGVNIDGHGVAREADTSDAGSAKLRYSFRRARFDDYVSGAWVKVQVSGDGGDSWTTLARHKFNRDDAADVLKQYDITDFIGPHTQIRVIGGPAEAVQAYIYLDNFEIELTMAGVAATTTTTTTTTPPTTTTSTSSTTTTTTTVPSTPTSTTTPVTTTTQATPPGTTTTIALPNPVETDPSPATAASTTTTTTTVVVGVGTELPPPQTTRAQSVPGAPPAPGTRDSFVSKMGLTMTDAMPIYYDPGEDGAGPSGDEATGQRTPLGGLTATFATTTETLRNHTASAVVLGVLVAWLALHGLGRTRRRRGAA